MAAVSGIKGEKVVAWFGSRSLIPHSHEHSSKVSQVKPALVHTAFRQSKVAEF